MIGGHVNVWNIHDMPLYLIEHTWSSEFVKVHYTHHLTSQEVNNCEPNNPLVFRKVHYTRSHMKEFMKSKVVTLYNYIWSCLYKYYYYRL